MIRWCAEAKTLLHKQSKEQKINSIIQKRIMKNHEKRKKITDEKRKKGRQIIFYT